MDDAAEIDRWIEELGGSSMAARSDATHRLASFGGAAVERLVTVAEGNWTNRFGIPSLTHTERRRGAIIALRLMGPAASAAVPTLIELLEADEPVLRTEAAMALAAFGRAAHRAIPALAARENDPDVNARAAVRQAVRALTVA